MANFQHTKRDPKTGRYVKGSGYLFTKISDGAPPGFLDSLSSRARDWFRSKAIQITDTRPNRLLKTNSEKTVPVINAEYIGKMIFFNYDPKWKKILPYYDRFPLIFPIEMYNNGSFLGINMHYLPPFHRAKLMDALYKTISNKQLDKTSKLQINYQLLKGAQRFSLFKPCIKKYLFNHVRSQFLAIEPEKWDMALLLPLSRFTKSTEEKVWKDSMEMLRR